jgi:hypothetical protein
VSAVSWTSFTLKLPPPETTGDSPEKAAARAAMVVAQATLKQIEDDEVGWHSFAQNLFEKFSNNQNFPEKFSNNQKFPKSCRNNQNFFEKFSNYQNFPKKFSNNQNFPKSCRNNQNFLKSCRNSSH